MTMLFRLTGVLLKAYGLGFAGDTGRSAAKPGKKADPARQRRRSFPVILLFPLLFAPLAVTLTMFANLLFDTLSAFHLESAILGFATGAGAFVVFFFGVFYVLSIFYFSSDVEKLLPLPIRPADILGAKFLVTTVYEYVGTLILLAPLYVTFGVRSGAGLPFYLTAAVVYAFLPIIPLAIASVIVMALMRFTTFARNRDAFNIVVSFAILILAFGFNFGVQRLAGNASDPATLLKYFGDAGKIAQITSAVFPGTGFAARALAVSGTWESLGFLALYVLVCVAAFAVFLFVGSLIYFAGAQGSGTASSRNRRLSAAEFEKGTSSAPVLVTYMMKELRVLVRTPIFLLNNVVMNFLFPFFLLLPFAAGVGGSAKDKELQDLLKLLKSGLFTGGGSGPVIALAIAFGLMVFVAGTNGIASTCLSRDGESCWFMKTIPMSYKDQILAKVLTGVLLSFAGTVIAGAVVAVLTSPPLWFLGLLLLAAVVAALLPNAIGVVFDLHWPKLHWDNEQKAVKQNANVIYEMLAAYALGAVAIAPPLAFGFAPVLSYVWMLVLPALVTAGVWLWVQRSGAAWVVSLEM